jgi:hypothetical protein
MALAGLPEVSPLVSTAASGLREVSPGCPMATVAVGLVGAVSVTRLDLGAPDARE